MLCLIAEREFFIDNLLGERDRERERRERQRDKERGREGGINR
jgi:hypothetical protein